MASRVKLSKRAVDALKPEDKRYTVWDTETAGFGVRVSPSGRKSFVFKYRVGGGRSGRVRWGLIGPYGALTPDQARKTAQDWAADVANGGDPAGDRMAKRQAPTVSELLDRYLSEHAKINTKPSSYRNAELLTRNIIRPVLGHIKAAELTRADVSKLHSANAHRPYTANRCLAVLSKACSLAEVWGLRPDGSNPCRQVQKYTETPRERYLSEAEYSRLSSVLREARSGYLELTGPDGWAEAVRVNPEAVRAIELLVYTGARVGEILGLRWDFIDLDAGRASLPDSKTGRKILQLPKPAIDILQEIAPDLQGRGYVIRGGTGADAEVPLVNVKSPWGVIRKAAGLEDVRLHDLRHAFASVAVASGMSLPMIGALLGHREASTTQRYAHLADAVQREAAAQVADRIEKLMK